MSESGLLLILIMTTLGFIAGFMTAYDHLDPNTIPHAVVILGDYQYKSAFVADQEINMLL